MSEKLTPVFDIFLGVHSKGTHVLCNGQDVTHALKGVTVTQQAGGVLEVTLTVLGTKARAIVEAAALLNVVDAKEEPKVT